MHITLSGASPFLLLWYVFLGFFAIVLVFQIIMVAIKLILQWRVTAVMKKNQRKV